MNKDLLFLLRTYEMIHGDDKEKAVEAAEKYIAGNLYILTPPQFLNVKRIPKSEREQAYKEFIGDKEDVFYSLQWTDGKTTRNHGVFRTVEAAIDSVNIWWDLNKFKPRYVRTWESNGVTTIDYGFHDMFYKVKQVSKSTFQDVMFNHEKFEV